MQYDINVDEMILEQAKEREEAANIIPKMQATIKKTSTFY